MRGPLFFFFSFLVGEFAGETPAYAALKLMQPHEICNTQFYFLLFERFRYQ